jgi:hypothetical protein
MTDDATKKELDQLARMFRTPWLAMRDRTMVLWSAAHSTDAAERIARKAGVGEDDARKLAPVIRDMVAALALALDRMPVRETRPALIPGANLDAYVERVHDVGRARGFFTTDERPRTYEEHQSWAQRPQSGVGVRGWLDHELVEGDAAGDMLRADRALLDVVGAYLTDSDREHVERYAQRVWATFKVGSPVTWWPGALGVGDTGVDDMDAKRLVLLWRRWLDGTHTKALVKAATTKLARDEEARREAERAEILRAERARHAISAHVRPFVAGALATVIEVHPQEELELNGRRRVATLDGRVIGYMREGGDAHALSSRAALRLIADMVRTVFRQHEEGHPDFRHVIISGGFDELSDRYGSTGNNNDAWRATLDAGRLITLTYADVEWAGLWSWARQAHAPGRRSQVELTVGSFLAPGWVHADPKRTGLNDGQSRRLVPQIDFDVPVGDLDRSKHGACSRAHYGLLLHMVDHATQIEARGGVVIPETNWQRIAEAAGLKRADVGRMRSAWLTGDDDKAPALLEHVTGDVYRLHTGHHARQWAFIEEGGQRRARSKRAGQEAAKKRHAQK